MADDGKEGKEGKEGDDSDRRPVRRSPLVLRPPEDNALAGGKLDLRAVLSHGDRIPRLILDLILPDSGKAPSTGEGGGSEEQALGGGVIGGAWGRDLPVILLDEENKGNDDDGGGTLESVRVASKGGWMFI